MQPKSTLSRPALAVAAGMLLMGPATGETLVTDLPLQDGGSQRVLYAAPANPRAALVMLPGGNGMVEIGNDDPVLHNTHIRSGGKTVLNVAMVPHGPNIQKQVKQPGLLNVKCDAHKFMQGFVMAFTHPFFSISDESGRFRIEGIPQGLHRITVWHETLGTLQKEVNVPAQGEISVHFNYP